MKQMPPVGEREKKKRGRKRRKTRPKEITGELCDYQEMVPELRRLLVIALTVLGQGRNGFLAAETVVTVKVVR